MRKGYSVIKRGNTYFLYHRKNLEKKLVGVSLKTTEQREAYRRAKEMAADLDRDLAIAKAPNPFEGRSEEEANAAITDWVNQLAKQHNEVEEKKSREYRIQRAKQKAEQRRALEEARQDAVNPKLDQIWCLAEKRKNDTGLFVEWGLRNRSENTMYGYRSAWKYFRKYLPHVHRLGDITPKVSREFENKLIKHADPSIKNINLYVKNYMMAVKGIISTAIKQGWWEGENRIHINTEYRRLKRDREIEFLSEEEVDILLRTASELKDKTVYLFIAIAVHTGMRKDEIANLRWEDFNFDRLLVKVQAKKRDESKGIQEFTTKSRQARSIPLKKELVTILTPFRKASGYIIQSERKIKRSRWTPTPEFKEVQVKSGIKFNPHLFRHTFASWAATKGISIYKIQKWLGHSSVQITTDIYAHLQDYDEDIDKF